MTTDIDIIVKPDADIMEYIENASKIYPFIRFEENTRVGANNIVREKCTKQIINKLTRGKK